MPPGQHSWTRIGGLLLAAVLGGAAAVGIGAAVGVGDDTTTVVSAVSGNAAAANASRVQVDDAASNGKSVQQIYRETGPGVVQVTSTTSGGDSFFGFGGGGGTALGSGFVVDKAGHVVTNYHVIEGADQVEVNFSGEDNIPARVVGADPSTDLAVLEIDAQARALTPLPLGNSDAIRVGDAVVAIGNPFGLERTVTAGIVSALQRQIQAPNGYTIDEVVQTDAPINQGNSGGPLLNAKGEVIGVNSQIESESGGNVGIGFAVPINTVKEVVSQVLQNGKVEHAFLGVEMAEITDSLLASYRLPVDKGALIVKVVPGSPADEAGVQGGDQDVVVDGNSYSLGGDIVTSADGQPVTSPDELASIVRSKDPGDSLTLGIQRDDSQETVTVTLGRLPNRSG
ncbi:MAG TPA: trypsin-like peptidase domain-containing protein [Gaiellaceae bacterium]|jgi:S1-C subfamily serine protease|nr:trypsin-like peptidase domain-containing protein [Gaiellaceae bacterium]